VGSNKDRQCRTDHDRCCIQWRNSGGIKTCALAHTGPSPPGLAIGGDDSAVELRKLRIYIADMDVGSPLARFHSARMAIRRTREWIV
jgi:hypothetical protein